VSVIESLLAAQEPAKTIVVEIDGHTLTFKAPASYPQARKLHASGQKMKAVFANSATCVGALAGLDTEGDEEAAFSAYVLSECSAEPKISHAEALQICKKAPGLFARLVVEVVAPILGIVPEMEAEAVEEGKKPCGETRCDGCSCEPPETAGANTPTN
jgi:hypothetical protein